MIKLKVDYSKIFILHYLPIEGYPPVLNTLEILQTLALNVRVMTTSNTNSRFSLINNFSISRYFYSKDNQLWRIFTYFRFNIFGFIQLLIHRPNKILYYETLSCFPALLYKLLFPKTEIFLHYHEYLSLLEISNSSLYLKCINRFEKNNLKKMTWISHTNLDRVSLFCRDYPSISSSEVRTWPNYPLSGWRKNIEKSNENSDLKRIVYVGSVSLVNSYLPEFLTWIQNTQDICLDIYSQNLTKDDEESISSIKNVNVKGVLDYKNLSEILPLYNTGVVLYKPTIPNVKYNIPNKVVEYLACGLSVWCPFEIETTYQWAVKNHYISKNVVKPSFFFQIDPKKVDTKILTAEQVFPYHLFQINKHL